MVDLRAWVSMYTRGLAMGTADAVPGVSGGTIALVVGIYQRLITAVTATDPVQDRCIVAGIAPENRVDARRAFEEVNGAFLTVLGASILAAIVLVLRLVNTLAETFPVATCGLFSI